LLVYSIKKYKNLKSIYDIVYKMNIRPQCVFSHVLHLTINDSLSETDQKAIIDTAYTCITEFTQIKWKQLDVKHYYTDVPFTDNEVKEHTKMLLDIVIKKIPNDKFNFMLTKPITDKLCVYLKQ
jgi:hypothetical protein